MVAGQPHTSLAVERAKIVAWRLYLLGAGLLEIGWPLGFKLSQDSSRPWLWILFAVISMAFSGALLWVAQKAIPIGTAYAVWTGIGAAGTFALGLLVFHDPAHWGRFMGAAMIVGGVIVLKLSPH